MLAVVGVVVVFLPTATASGIRGAGKVDLSTGAAIAKYVRSLGINPNGMVIQRGARNYAGPKCPGKGWNCTRARKVIQIATGDRVSLFASKPTPTGNVVKCSKSTGTDQSCSGSLFVQVATGSTTNSATVEETIQTTGQTQSGKQFAQISQTSDSGSNTVRMEEQISQSATTGAPSVSQSVTSDQSFSISQTSNTGGQSIQVEQSSLQSETASSATTGTQYASGNLVGHFTQSSSGVSSAKIKQVHNITQQALGPKVDQTAVDPFRCCANQVGNPSNTTTLAQNGSVQTSGDTTPTITAAYNADCGSSGTCKVTETNTTNGTTTTNTSSGATVTTGLSCAGTSCTPGARFPTGDLLAAVSNGMVQEWDVSGATPTLVRTLDTGLGGFTTGMAFDGADNLYATDFSAGAVSKFAPPDGSTVSTFASGLDASPESILFDDSGNAFVGLADGTRQILKFDSAGSLLASYSPVTEDRGSDWIALGPDGCTIYYTSEGTSVKRFDVCTNTQLADFATGLTGSFAYSLQLLPDGGLLVGDSEQIVRLNAAGSVVQTYDAPGEDSWFAVQLDPNGTSFWAADFTTSDVKKFNLTTGAVEAAFNTGTATNTVFGFAVAP